VVKTPLQPGDEIAIEFDVSFDRIALQSPARQPGEVPITRGGGKP